MFSSKCPLCDSELTYYLEHNHPDCYNGPLFIACPECSPCGWGFEPDDFNYVITLGENGKIMYETICVDNLSKDGILIENRFFNNTCYIFFAENSSSITLDNVYISAKDLDKIKTYAMLA